MTLVKKDIFYISIKYVIDHGYKHERIPKMHYIQRGSLLSPSNLHIKTISIYQEHQYIIKTEEEVRGDPRRILQLKSNALIENKKKTIMFVKLYVPERCQVQQWQT